tara:strand:- start:375 stop:602 length:228 start_codon:yes stop_codon:yes gene_type:complete
MNSKSMFMLKDLNDWENCYMEELTIRTEYINLLNFKITLKLLFARTKVKNPNYLHKIIQKGRIRTDKKIVDFIKT